MFLRCISHCVFFAFNYIQLQTTLKKPSHDRSNTGKRELQDFTFVFLLKQEIQLMSNTWRSNLTKVNLSNTTCIVLLLKTTEKNCVCLWKKKLNNISDNLILFLVKCTNHTKGKARFTLHWLHFQRFPAFSISSIAEAQIIRSITRSFTKAGHVAIIPYF